MRWGEEEYNAYLARTGRRSAPQPPEPQPRPKAKSADAPIDRIASRMNGTEAAYSGYLNALKLTGEVVEWWFNAMHLRLAPKCFYQTDFVVQRSDGTIEVHEVKGFWRDDALVKIKVAAEKFPFRFLAVTKTKDGWDWRPF